MKNKINLFSNIKLFFVIEKFEITNIRSRVITCICYKQALYSYIQRIILPAESRAMNICIL